VSVTDVTTPAATGATFNLSYSTAANRGAIRAISGSVVWTAPITLTGPTDFRAEAGAQLNILGTISDSKPGANFTVNKVGAGEVIFSGFNTYGGLTDVKEGVLTVRNPRALGVANATTGKTIVEKGAALDLQSNLTLERVELNGDGIPFNGHNTGALRNVSNNNVFTGTLFLSGNSTIGVDSGSTLTIGVGAGLPGAGVITDGAGTFGFTKELTGTLVLNTPNSYHGDTIIAQGALGITNPRALGSTPSNVRVLAGAQLVVPSNLTITGKHLFLSGSGIFNTGALLIAGTGVSSWGGQVTLVNSPATVTPPAPAAPQGSIDVLSATATFVLNTPVDGDGGLIKFGAGRLILTKANTYTGLTTVAQGDLQVDGTIGNVALGGGSLSGKGTVGAITMAPAASGIVSPGDNGTPSPTGILTSGAVTWNSATTFAVNLNGATPGTGYDQLVVNGNINLGSVGGVGGASLVGSAGAVGAGTKLTIIKTNGGTITGTFAGLANNATFTTVNGRRFRINYTSTTVDLTAL
jgi:autotransporter-associated beta strand protein